MEYKTGDAGGTLMQTSIYKLLEHDHPQSLQDLWDFQMKTYGTCIDPPEEIEPPLTLERREETLKEFEHEMKQTPSSKGDNKGL
jgi:hypothetical protein